MDKPIKLSRVKLAYSGKAETCHCGCSGKYWYPEMVPYRDPEEVSLAKVKRIVNKLNKNASEVTYIKGRDEDIYALTIGKHDWTVYLKPYSNLDLLEDKYEEKVNSKKEG
jgi:hypothetical protein